VGDEENVQMRRWLHALLIVAAIALLASVQAEGQSGSLPRTPDGRPNFNGIWQALTTAAWNIQDHHAQLGVPAGQGVVEGNEIPYQPSALAKKQENFKNRQTADLVERRGFLPGVPRIMYMPFPFQIVQTPGQVTMLFEYAHAMRHVFMNSKHPEGEVGDIQWWLGDSRGRWEGDTLVVDVTSFNDQTWFDRAGNFHSDALHVVERFTLRSPDVIWYEATIEDPNVFTRPWRIAMPLYRRLEPNMQLLEYRCTEFVEEFMYGHVRKEQLVKRWEGETITVDITRKVPPGDGFHDWYRR
jgi:hypothetical protein